jgi:hypothetical protein
MSAQVGQRASLEVEVQTILNEYYESKSRPQTKFVVVKVPKYLKQYPISYSQYLHYWYNVLTVSVLEIHTRL